jgi:hypothetical protein
MQYAPDVEIWGVNVYGSLLSRLPAKMKALGWTRAYAVTEYGPYVRCPCCCCVALRLQHALTRKRATQNWWQVKQTSWGAALEPSSTEKAATYRAAAEAFSADASCIGGFVFKWGFKFQVRRDACRRLRALHPLRARETPACMFCVNEAWRPPIRSP